VLFFETVLQAGIVALGLFSQSPHQPAAAGSTSRFEACVARVLAVEGGYVEHRVDRGGATKHGITRSRLPQHRGRSVTKAEVRALTKAEAVQIYRAVFWNGVRADELPPGLDDALFDFAVHSGVPRAARALQRALGLPADGRIGPATLAAARNADTTLVLMRLRGHRLAFMSELPAWRTFGKGWRARMSTLEAALSKPARTDVADARAAFGPR
jgi:lysozyme family protein